MLNFKVGDRVIDEVGSTAEIIKIYGHPIEKIVYRIVMLNVNSNYTYKVKGLSLNVPMSAMQKYYTLDYTYKAIIDFDKDLEELLDA